MKFISFVFLAALTLTACASAPFQKFSGEGEGYSVTDVEKDHFRLKANLPYGSNSQFIGYYILRAVGEECRALGFPYFHFVNLTKLSVLGLCFPGPDRKMLGVEFEVEEGMTTAVLGLVVKKVDPKPSTHLQKGDIVTKINGKSVGTMEFLRKEIFLSEKSGGKAAKLELFRDGQFAQVEEPLVTVGEGALAKNFGPNDLAEFRELVP